MTTDQHHFTLANSWPYKIAFFALFVAMCLSSVMACAKEPASFAGIHNGMAEASLPSTLQPDAWKSTYRGIIDGDYLEVDVSQGKVSGFRVTYLGKNQNLDLITKPMKLREAVARHSAAVPRKPEFAKAVSRSGMPTELADTANIILYYTGGSTSPEAQVQYVGYANRGAPFANVRKSQRLSNLEAAELLSLEPVTPANVPASVSVAPAVEYLKASTREAAIKTHQRLIDETLGTGRRVDALIDQAEIWLSVDQRHPEAKQTFCDLLSYSVKFDKAFKSLATAYAANKSLLSTTDIEALIEPTEMRKAIDRRMWQVRAMGYDGAMCLM